MTRCQRDEIVGLTGLQSGTQSAIIIADTRRMFKSETLASVNDELRLRKRKIIERVLLSGVLAGSVLVIVMFSSVIGRIAEQFLPPKSDLYGVWIEQNVAPYAAQQIELEPRGVLIEGRVMTTSFDFDGRYLEYRIGEQRYRYRMLNEQHTEMTLISPAHYNPTFQLSGKYQKNLR